MITTGAAFPWRHRTSFYRRSHTNTASSTPNWPEPSSRN